MPSRPRTRSIYPLATLALWLSACEAKPEPKLVKTGEVMRCPKDGLYCARVPLIKVVE